MNKQILAFTLQNAIKYDGKASENAVIGVAFSHLKNLKKIIILEEVKKIVKEVNSWSLEKQKKEFKKFNIRTKKRKQADLFDFFDIRKGQKIITAFPPGPEKYPHIGHAKALILNYLLAKKYKGKFFLRFEDTNPELVQEKFYKIMLKDLKWLKIKWDKLQYASDHMNLFYKSCEKLIKQGQVYICYCKREIMQKNRKLGIACKCRTEPNQLEKWKKYFKAKKGSAVVRLKIDMTHKNTTMRDPVIFRIINKVHPRLKKKYRIWPNYDFQNAIMDGYFGVTHRIRSKEFELRSELQRYIQKLLGLTITQTYEMGRLNMEGVPSSGRLIREKIKNKEFLGWDDPRLTTIAALRRRGFLPEAIKNFIINSRISKTSGTAKWDKLDNENRKIIDKRTNRYFYIWSPKKIKIKNAPALIVKAPLHPDYPKRGSRTFKTKDQFYICDELNKHEYRFMHLFNFKDKKFLSKEYKPELNAKLIHWLPVSKDLVKVEVLNDDGKLTKGFGEPLLKKLKVGDIVQLERYGFVRLDKKEKNRLLFWWLHR